MAPILYSCHFGGGQFAELARVLRVTADRHCPHWDRRIDAIAGHQLRSAHDAYADNTHKLDQWNAFIQSQPDGARVLLIDADTAIVRPLDCVWNWPFDVAYTIRPSSYKLPLNGGVVFVYVNDRSKAFMANWAAVNRQMVSDRALHSKWRKKFGGINQASFGCVRDQAPTVRFWMLPCVEWNCEDSSWPDFSPEVTRILHVKSLLRRCVFNLTGSTGSVKAAAKYWRALQQESQVPA